MCLLLIGCGKPKSEVPAVLVPVTGTVTVDGAPGPGVNLTFFPQGGTTGTGGGAATDASGAFKVLHRSGTPGIEPGMYIVIASQFLTPSGNPVPTGESAMDHDASERLPARYQDPEHSPIHVTVKEGMEPLNLEIKTK